MDAAAALEHASGEAVLEGLGKAHRYHSRVFLAPPWPETYRADRERRHEFGVAEEEYLRLLKAYRLLGYEIALLFDHKLTRRDTPLQMSRLRIDADAPLSRLRAVISGLHSGLFHLRARARL